jgi:hypothetical protein
MAEEFYFAIATHTRERNNKKKSFSRLRFVALCLEKLHARERAVKSAVSMNFLQRHLDFSCWFLSPKVIKNLFIFLCFLLLRVFLSVLSPVLVR